jgi:amidase
MNVRTFSSVDRRTFLRYGAGAGVLIASAPKVALAAGARPAEARRPDAAVASSFEWEEATIAELQAAMSSGALTALELTRAYLERIAALDHDGPRLNAILETNPEAEAIADALDAERAVGHVRGPLHGIPVVLKDNIATEDAMQTTAGSLALVGSKVPRDAGIARTLREAGAVLLAKSNMSEWTGFRGWPLRSGWSGRAGQGHNPYALGYTPGTSSSGSAAAVSANLTVGGVGTETYGSILMPSALCGVVGVKPTLGLTSRSGVIPIAFSRDVTGPICRTVADAATLLGGMVGVDPYDEFTRASRGHFHTDYRPFLDPGGLRGARLGYWSADRLFGRDRGLIDPVVASAVEGIRELGATVVDDVRVRHEVESVGHHIAVLFTEFRPGIDAYLAGLTESPVRTLADVIAFNDAHAEAELRWLDQSTLEGAQAEPWTLSSPGYLRALHASRRLAREGLRHAMRTHRLDAIITPTFREAWPIDLLHGDPFEAGQGSSGPHNAAGYPNITVPAGFVGELPVGLSFIAGAWSESKLLRLAFAFEQGYPVRRVPQLLEGYGERDFVERP